MKTNGIKKLCLLLVTLFLAPPAMADGGLGGLFSSIGNALGVESKEKTPQQKLTPTMGVRGMDEAEASNTAPSSDGIKQLDSWSATKVEAEISAGKRGLKPNPNVSYRDDAQKSGEAK